MHHVLRRRARVAQPADVSVEEREQPVGAQLVEARLPRRAHVVDDQRVADAGRRADGARPPVERRAAAAHRRAQLVHQRVVDDADGELLRDGDADRDGDERVPVHEVRRAVERVDDPRRRVAERERRRRRRRRRPRRRRALREGRLLADERVVRVPRADRVDDQLLRRLVRRRHQVDAGGRAFAMTNPMKADGHHSNSAPQTGHCFAITGISAPQAPHSAVFFVDWRRLGFCLAG